MPSDAPLLATVLVAIGGVLLSFTSGMATGMRLAARQRRRVCRDLEGRTSDWREDLTGLDCELDGAAGPLVGGRAPILPPATPLRRSRR